MKLAAEEPWGNLPSEVGPLKMSEHALTQVTEVLQIGEADVSSRLNAAIGVPFPQPGATSASAGVRALWSGRGAALVLGARVEIEGALCVDQSDAWAGLELSGAVQGVLARLCPLDLRDASFPPGATARTLLNHVSVSLTRLSEEAWLLLAPRSAAGTVLEEIVEAAQGLAAR